MTANTLEQRARPMRRREIEDIVKDLQDAGCVFYHGGPHWITILPPPPSDLLLEVVERGNDLDEFIIRRGLYRKEPAP